MFEGCKKKAEVVFLNTTIPRRRENPKLAKEYRDVILYKLKKDKPKLMTHPSKAKVNNYELFYNKYQQSDKPIKDTDWYLKIKQNLEDRVSNFFILHGNIMDQAIPRWKVEDYLKEKLITDLDIKDICTIDFVSLNGMLDTHEYNVDNRFDCRFFEAIHHIKNTSIRSKRALIIKYPEYILCDSGKTPCDRDIGCIVVLRNLIDDLEFVESGNCIFILTDNLNCINNQLIQCSSSTTQIEIPLPSLEDRIEMINYLENQNGYLLNHRKKGVEIAGNITAGLNLNHIEKIWRSSFVSCKLDYDKIREYKKEFMKKGFEDKIDIIEPNKDYNLDTYGGMNYVKEYLREGVIAPIISGDKKMIPRGMLFMGSPGTGKSFMAKCLASEAGINFVELNVSKFTSKWVGETEENLQKVLMCVKALSPCFLFIDEIDQVLQRGDGDSNPVRGNIFQIMMKFLGDPDIKGKVIVIGATNYPNKIDEALKRAGRFDIKLVFTPPLDKKEIKDVLKIHLDKINYPIAFESYGPQFEDILSKLEGYSQAEIELITTKALSLAKRNKESCIKIDTFLKAISYIRKSNNKKIEEMIDLAIEECNDLEFLPKQLIQEKIENNIKKIEWD